MQGTASKQPDRPSKEEWDTSIPELLVSPFTRADLAKVHECLRAIEPIEARGMTLVSRIELAALLASACSREKLLAEVSPGLGAVWSDHMGAEIADNVSAILTNIETAVAKAYRQAPPQV
jgi:hypothetical protein